MTLVIRHWSGIKDHACKEKETSSMVQRWVLLRNPIHLMASSATRVLLESFASISVPADVHMMGLPGPASQSTSQFLTSLTFCLIY